MRTIRNQWKLDEFKKSCILKNSKNMTQDYEFIKGFTLDIMMKYTNLLDTFLNQSNIATDEFHDEIKPNSNTTFLEYINFVTMIPKVLKIYDDDATIDYNFLEQHFKKIEDNQKALELKSAINEFEQQAKLANSCKSDPSLSYLYRFGEFILNLLTDEEVRADVFFDLLTLKVEEKEDEFKENFDRSFVQQHISSDKILKSWIIADQQI